MFLGCFFLAETTGIELLGFVLLFFGIRTASRHCDCFKYAEKLCYAGFAVSAVKLAKQIAGMMGVTLLNTAASNIFASVYTAVMVIFINSSQTCSV